MRRVFKYLGILLALELIVVLGAVIPAHAALSLNLSVYSGTPGTAVTVSGTTTGTPPDTISIYFDSTFLTSVVANSPSWSTSVTIPSAAAGTSHTINANGTGGSASLSFTILPKINFSPSSGGAGTSTTIRGYGFYSGESVTVNFNNVSIGTAYADTTGSWSTPLTVPSLAAGYYNIDAIGTSSSTVSSSQGQFQVISTAVISVSSKSGQVGSSVSLSGSGFLANETITATLDGTTVGTGTTAGSTGSWTLTFPVPPAPSGSHTISAYGSVTVASSVTGISYNISPTFTINKTSGASGTSIIATGSGFASGEQGIVVTIDGTPVGTPVQANAAGSWTSTISIPVLSGGSHSVSAQGSTTSSSSLTAASFSVGAGVSINKNTGTAGTAVIVSGSGFGAGENGITISLDGNPIGSTVSANDKGSWTANVTIPPSAGGAHAITASGPSTPASSVPGATFTIQATISGPNKTTGPTGTTVTLSGAGFGPSETGITISYDGVPASQAVTASATGDWTSSFNVPESAAGSHDIKVSGRATTATTPPTVSFKITSGISLSSDKGTIGGTLTLSGTGFAASSPLKITYDNSAIPSLATVSTDEKGSFSRSFPVPKSAGGDHVIKVTDGANNTDSKTFTIDTTPPPVPKLASPADGDRIGFTGDVVTVFKWGAVTSPNAPITYVLQVDNDTEFASPILEKTLDTNTYSLSKREALKQGTYYWRVKAIDAASNQSTWSQPRVLQAGLMSTALLIILIILVVAALATVVYILIIRPRAKARRAAAVTSAPEIVIPEVVNAEYRTLDSEDQTKKRSLPWRLALPQAPPAPKGAKNLSTEDQARLKVIIDFAKSLPLVEPGNNTHWLVDMAENATGNSASPALYDQIVKGEIQLRYEPAWMRHPTFLDLQTLLEGQPILQDLNSFVESVNGTASESVLLLQDIYKDVTSDVNWDILANGGWAYVSGIYADSLSWFLGKYLREPSDREYTTKPEGQNSEGTSVFGLYGEANTPFTGLLVKAPGDEETARLRALHMKLRRVYRSNDRGRTIVGMITQLDVQRTKLLSALSQFNRLNT